jgi:membrane protein
MRTLWGMLKKTFEGWNQHEATRMGAALAFYSILSLDSLLILMIAIVALVYGERGAQGQIASQAQNIVGPQAVDALQKIMESARKPSSGGLAAALGLMTLLFGASAVFTELREDLNTMWEAKPQESTGLMAMIRDRIFAFAMILGAGFLLLISLLASAVLQVIEKYFSSLLPVSGTMLWWANFIGSFILIALLFALIFKYVPDVDIRWKDVWLGAFVTALLFTIGKLLIDLYLGKAGVGSAYGAAGSLVAVVVWIYYSAQIFLFGAEFTKVYAETAGSKMRPRGEPKTGRAA